MRWLSARTIESGIFAFGRHELREYRNDNWTLRGHTPPGQPDGSTAEWCGGMVRIGPREVYAGYEKSTAILHARGSTTSIETGEGIGGVGGIAQLSDGRLIAGTTGRQSQLLERTRDGRWLPLITTGLNICDVDAYEDGVVLTGRDPATIAVYTPRTGLCGSLGVAGRPIHVTEVLPGGDILVASSFGAPMVMFRRVR